MMQTLWAGCVTWGYYPHITPIRFFQSSDPDGITFRHEFCSTFGFNVTDREIMFVREIDEWCRDNCTPPNVAPWHRRLLRWVLSPVRRHDPTPDAQWFTDHRYLSWPDHFSYLVQYTFRRPEDAMMFKLVWQQ